MEASESHAPAGQAGTGDAGNGPTASSGGRPAGRRHRPPSRRFASLRVTGRSRRIGELAREAVGSTCQIDVDRQDESIWITVSGQLDMSCSDRFIACLREARDAAPAELVIDLRALTFVDSTGLSMLLKADALARQNHFELHIVRSRGEIVQAVLEATGVDKFLPLVDEPPALAR